MPANDPSTESVFFAYSGQPALAADTVRQAASNLQRRGVPSKTWEQMDIAGSFLIQEICREIDSATVVVAEIGSLNANVLFEAGYAIARNKKVYFALDESDSAAERSWDHLSLIQTVGRINYGGNAEKLADGVYKALANGGAPLFDELLAGGKAQEDNAVFAPPFLSSTTAADRLKKYLDRQTHLHLLISQDDFGNAALGFYAKEAYRSSAAILHFAGPTRKRASEYNARLALVGGFLHGLERPLLMVAEDTYTSPLDYRDMLFNYNNSISLVDHVNVWLQELPLSSSGKRLGRRLIDVELPLESFGQFVAENESDALDKYFVQTSEFQTVLQGGAPIFAGRKGTGKSANMILAAQELRGDKRNLVVPILPSAYDLAGLTQLLASMAEDESSREYFLLQLWFYLLTTEISFRAIGHAESLPAGLGSDNATSDLGNCLETLGLDRESDFTTRLDDLITVVSQSLQQGQGARVVADAISQRMRTQLMPSLRAVLANYSRVALLIDNLDATWQVGADFESLSRFLLSLLTSQKKISDDFSRSRKGQPSVNLSMTIFLRADIYDYILELAREPDKIKVLRVAWHDEELLIRVLEERYVALREGKKKLTDPQDMWNELFCPEVHSLPTRDYLLWRSLPRPRDIIFLANSALELAINRRHGRVLSQDFIPAEEAYSRFAFEALLVESEAQGMSIEECLESFAGLDATLTESDLNVLLDVAIDPAALLDWLLATGFLGIEMKAGDFTYVEDATEVRKKKVIAGRLALREGRCVRYRVHPAFRPYLSISDDDLHVD